MDVGPSLVDLGRVLVVELMLRADVSSLAAGHDKIPCKRARQGEKNSRAARVLWSIRLFPSRPNHIWPRPPRAVAGCEDGSVMAGTDPYGTRAELLPGVSYHRLGALAERGIGDVSRLPVTLKILLENSVRNCRRPVGPRGRRRGDRELGRHRLGRRPRARVHARPGPAPGLHRRPGGRRPRRDALRGRAGRRRSDAHRSAGPGRPGHRSLGAGRRLRQSRGVRTQHRARVRAQPRALRAAPLGAAGVPGLSGGPARDGDRPPDQPRVPRPGGPGARDRWGAHGPAGHAGRHRLAHADGQRHRGARLGSRRHRGRGLHARPAALPARAGRGRRSLSQRAAGGHDRDRPGAHADRVAPQATVSSTSSSSSAAAV